MDRQNPAITSDKQVMWNLAMEINIKTKPYVAANVVSADRGPVLVALAAK